ncbi:MAG: exonuclease SbcCD subunit D [Planctomycetota bacterium]|nr:exonuclease SbcCD subunit D [Planctomycetota bacterium]
MRFIHSADWHLGRLFHGLHLTDDQSYILDDFVKLVADSKVDAVIIAGDIYDRSVPPAAAVQLLDEVLTKLAVELGVPVVLIAGNHDSPHRLGFGSRLFQNHKVTVAGPLSLKTKPLLIRDKWGSVAVHTLPYCEPGYAREALGDPSIKTQDQAVGALLKTFVQAPEQRSILVGHLHSEGGQISESERPLSVWDDGRVRLQHFKDFNYTALGHLHLPQVLGQGRVHYPGSLLKYSFGEASETKGISLVDMDAHGDCHVERIHLTPRRDVRCLEGIFEDLLQNGEAYPHRHDYLKITLLDRGPILEAMTRLREFYPHLLHIERPKLSYIPESQGPRQEKKHQTLGASDLFTHFFKEVTGDEMNEDEKSLFTSIIRQRNSQEREVLF